MGGTMTEENMKQFEEMLGRHLGVFHESIQHKLDLVIEGQQAMGDKVDRLVDRLEGKMDDLSVGLAAHRAEAEWSLREE